MDWRFGQQSFLQMRLEGLGKPFEVAAKEFVCACIDAHKSSVGMEELQLQLILADGALSGAFAVQSDDPKQSYLMTEEARIRAAWIRYIYVAIAEILLMKKTAGADSDLPVPDLRTDDPSDAFVRQVIKAAADEGYTLSELKLQQEYSGPAESPSVKTLRQANFLILLTYDILTMQ